MHMARRELLPDWYMATLSIDYGWEIVERYIQNRESLNAKMLGVQALYLSAGFGDWNRVQGNEEK